MRETVWPRQSWLACCQSRLLLLPLTSLLNVCMAFCKSADRSECFSAQDKYSSRRSVSLLERQIDIHTETDWLACGLTRWTQLADDRKQGGQITSLPMVAGSRLDEARADWLAGWLVGRYELLLRARLAWQAERERQCLAFGLSPYGSSAWLAERTAKTNYLPQMLGVKLPRIQKTCKRLLNCKLYDNFDLLLFAAGRLFRRATPTV